ncbi:hypothetical protein GFO_2849 [Christiangramia forsetii KT0803]|uniref:Uncharacterized protein n=1 Tax=Christiangramia forsetii (strain DSM 17595 / CGMCC 1.15422 / KT0803) TaxID=411154 RepID=A0M5A8_CHRFK|nr:hypothetical protein GFO_2849 [Christiangramia forsetii KT0803]
MFSIYSSVIRANDLKLFSLQQFLTYILLIINIFIAFLMLANSNKFKNESKI